MSETATEMTTLDSSSLPSPLFLRGAEERYEVLEKVAAGGMGVVYRGRHRLLNRQVAIKICLPGADLGRFRREAELLASVRSPHVVSVHDFEVLPDGRPILVMDWIDGDDLRSRLVGHPGGVPETEAISWLTDVCEGMWAAEERRVVHRDLKPSNILLDRTTGRALVSDFGLARAPTVDALTIPNEMMGTPYYMAPEQAEDPGSVDTRADIYSLGATFYHLCTGRPPFSGTTTFSILYKHKTEPLSSPRELRMDLSVWTSDLIERCLAKSPADRFGSFSDILSILKQTGPKPSSWEFSDDVPLRPYLGEYAAARSQILSPGSRGVDFVLRFPAGRMLTICSGDLATQRVDALVSSDDAWLSMGGGVSCALRDAAGPSLEEFAVKFVPVRAGRSIVTPAGNLPSRFVIHAITIDVADGRMKLPSRDLVAELMESCFYHADSLRIRTIAFPLLGTGAGRLARDLSLDTMVTFLARKFLHGLTSIQEARIILR